jgi:hypothetical protein
MFLLGDDLPRVVSTVSNLSLFKLILAMCKLVLLSMGEQEFPWGQRLCWLGCWRLSFGLETSAVGLDMIAAAAAASDCLVTAMLG